MPEEPFELLCLPSVENIKQILAKFSFPVTLRGAHYPDLEFIFKDKKITILHKGRDLKDFSFVWLSSTWSSRDLGYAIRLYLEAAGTPTTYVEKSTSKVTDHMLFALNGLPVPATLFFNHKDIENHLARIKKVCGYPLIIKDIKGARGACSEYVASEKDLREKIKKLPKRKRYLFQKYIHNEYDWGLMVANGAVVSGEKSYPSQGEFRNNACNGAKEVFTDLADIPSALKQIAIKASEALGLSWSRADIIIDKKTKKPYLMEVNRYPGITSKTSEVEGAYAFLSSHITQLANNQRNILSSQI